MKSAFFSVLLAAAVPLASAAPKIDLSRIEPVPANEEIPIADFFRPALLQNPQVNDAGTHIAAVVTAGKDKHELMIYDVEKKTLQFIGGVGDMDIYSFSWLNDRRLAYWLARDKLYGLGMMAVDIDHLRDSHPVVQYWATHMLGVPERNRQRGAPLVWASLDGLNDSRDRGVVELDTSLNLGGIVNLRGAGTDYTSVLEVRENNDRHVLKTYPAPAGMSAGYFTDRNDELAFAYTGENGVFALHRLEGGVWQKCPVDLDKVDIIGAGNEPGQLVVLAPQEPGKPRALRFMNSATGELGQVLVQDSGYDFEGWLYRDRTTHEIVGAMYNRTGIHSVWFSDSYRDVQKAVSALFPNQIVLIVDNDKKGRCVVATWSDREPAVFHWVDLEQHSVGLIKKSKPWIDPARMQPMNVLKFKTRDGHQLEAFVTLPAGTSKKHPAPLLVLPHGGPWVRDDWGFDGEAQFFASRGYAVIQPNYRGSPGYGWMFPAEDEWAFRKMHDDVTDATKTLLATGLIDRGRVAIGGSSFGAYLSLSGVVNEPDLYRCAVAIAGVYDWEQVMKDEKYTQYENHHYAYMRRQLGDPAKEKEKFDAISPVRHCEKIRVPVFVAHGKDDPVASVTESKRLISELEKHNVPHESLFVSGEGHGMGHLENEVELYSRVEAFLTKYLAPTKVAPPPAAAKP